MNRPQRRPKPLSALIAPPQEVSVATLRIALPLLPSATLAKNRQVGQPWQVLYQRRLRERNILGWQLIKAAREQGFNISAGMKPLFNKATLVIHLHFRDRRARDWDGLYARCSVLLDMLCAPKANRQTGWPILTDDDTQHLVSYRVVPHMGSELGPMTVITIRESSDEDLNTV